MLYVLVQGGLTLPQITTINPKLTLVVNWPQLWCQISSKHRFVVWDLQKSVSLPSVLRKTKAISGEDGAKVIDADWHWWFGFLELFGSHLGTVQHTTKGWDHFLDMSQILSTRLAYLQSASAINGIVIWFIARTMQKWSVTQCAGWNVVDTMFRTRWFDIDNHPSCTLLTDHNNNTTSNNSNSNSNSNNNTTSNNSNSNSNSNNNSNSNSNSNNNNNNSKPNHHNHLNNAVISHFILANQITGLCSHCFRLLWLSAREVIVSISINSSSSSQSSLLGSASACAPSWHPRHPNMTFWDA